jgi:DNA repair protein RadC
MTDVIGDLPRDERPRERLLMHGASTLSDAELIAILLGSGRRGKNAIQVARELLADGLSALRRRETTHLSHVCGIGPAKAARIGAALEIARCLSSGVPEDPPAFDANALGSELVMRYAQQLQERLGAAFLDSRHRIVRQREIFVGTTNRTLVSTGDIIRFALLDGACAVVIYHNHPSGNPTPSLEDETFTRKLQQSLGLVDIELIDHLIIGAHGYLSMREKGMI